jgi:Ser/Thr protein kinase RdoA (MazF antagonist)
MMSGEDMMKEPTIAAKQLTGTAAEKSNAETLEEIARRLTRIHVSLATNLDGGRELQSWTREQIESLMAYVDAVIDTHATRD